MPNVNRQTIYQMGNVVNDVVKQATGRDIVKQIDMDWVTVEQQKKEMLDVYSGDFIYYDAANTDPLKSVKAFIRPVQDLNGYTKPWVGGAGKNLINKNGFPAGTTTTVTVLDKGITVAVATSGNNRRVSQDMPVDLLGKTVTIHADVTTSSTNYARFGLYFADDSAVTQSISITDGTGSKTTTIEIPAAFPEGSTRILFTAYACTSGMTDVGVSATYDNLQLEIGSTATTWEPYANICPITGYAEGNIYHTGKNLAKCSDTNKGSNQTSSATYTESGVILSVTGQYGRTGWLFPVKNGKVYTLSFKAVSSKAREDGMNNLIYIGTADGVWFPSASGYVTNKTVTTTEQSFSQTITADSDVIFMGIYASATATEGSITVSDLMLVSGSTAGDYEPYNGNIYNYDWTGTVYNGVIDPTKSNKTVTSDMLSIDLDTLTWEYDSTYNRFVSTAVNGIVPPDSNDTAGNIICSAYQVITANQTTIDTYPYAIALNKDGEIIIKDARFTTVSDFLTGIDGYQLVYQTSEVTYYNFTGVDIASLAGDNNIWSDVGDMEVIYAYKEDVL